MNPNGALQLLRDALRDSRFGAREHDSLVLARSYAEILDEWLTRGGDLPDAWDHRECGCICRLGPDCPGQGRCDGSAIAGGESC